MKKGIFFSIISFLVIILLITFIKFNQPIKTLHIQEEVIRIDLLNDHVKNLEDIYFEQLVAVASKNALIGISKYYYDNQFSSTVIQKRIDAVFKEAVYTGIITDKFKKEIDLTTNYIDPKYTIDSILKEMNTILATYGIVVDELTFEFGNLIQEDPWTISVPVTISYYFRDIDDIANWRGYVEKEIKISVYGMYLNDLVQIEGVGPITNSWISESSGTEPSVLQKLSGKKEDNSGEINGVCGLTC